MAATSVIVLDRGNNTTATINLHGMDIHMKFSGKICKIFRIFNFFRERKHFHGVNKKKTLEV